MTKFEMLKEIAINCIENRDKAIHFAFISKEHKSVEEVKNLYAEYKSGNKDKEYFATELIGYTPLKKQAYLKRYEK